MYTWYVAEKSTKASWEADYNNFFVNNSELVMSMYMHILCVVHIISEKSLSA